jgi:hypothetical protein
MQLSARGKVLKEKIETCDLSINQSCISAIFQHIQRNTSELRFIGRSSGDIVVEIAINMKFGSSFEQGNT